MKLRPAALAIVLGAGCAPASSSAPVTPIIVESPADAGAASSASAVATERETPASAEPEPAVSTLEKTLLSWSKASQCPDYDYFPNGGIRNFWCHRPASLTFAAVREAAGGKVFTSGPHGTDDLVLDARNDFGRYDPAFVRWLGDSVPAKSNAATQAAYDRAMQPLARIFWKVLGKARSEKACFDKEKNAYSDLIAKKKLPAGYYERWFWFMNPLFCSRPPKGSGYDSYLSDHGMDGGVDGNVTKTVVGFWIRRSLDGTIDGWASALEKLLAVYDRAALENKVPPKKRGPDVGY